MNALTYPIVVVGAGLAGWAVIDALRAKTDTAIVLLTLDDGDRYHKPMLSSGFGAGKSPDDLVRMTGVMACQTANITLLSRSQLLEIHSDSKTLIYKKDDKNHNLNYSYLILATGATPTYPQGIQPSLATDLNHLDGYRTIYQLIQTRKTANKPCTIAVIGAGMVGVEIAEDLANAGVQVYLLDTHSHPLSSLLPSVAGRRFAQALQDIGIDYLPNVRPKSSQRLGDDIQLVLDNEQTICSDGVIVATGLGFDKTLAQSAGIAHSDGGIIVDEYLQTSVEGIFALGDVAVIDGVPCRFVAVHRNQAATIANFITNTPTTYQHSTPMIRLKNKSINIQATGQAFAKDDWQLVSDEDGKLVMNKVDKGQQIATLTVTQKTIAS